MRYKLKKNINGAKVRYKLKKNINGAKEGTIFDHNKTEGTTGICLVEGKSLGYIQDLITAIGVDNKEWFQKIEEERSIYDLKNGDIYYELDSKFCLVKNKYSDDGCYWFKLKSGNIFLTKEDAKIEGCKRTATVTIKKWCWDNDRKFKIIFDKFYYEIAYKEFKLITVKNCNFKTINNIYYSSREIAEKALNELREEYNILFKKKESAGK